MVVTPRVPVRGRNHGNLIVATDEINETCMISLGAILPSGMLHAYRISKYLYTATAVASNFNNGIPPKPELPMLVLSRKLGEKIVIGDNVVVTVVKIDRNQIRIGIEAPIDVPVYRQEIAPNRAENRNAGEPALLS